jgi:hypothetical protein
MFVCTCWLPVIYCWSTRCVVGINVSRWNCHLTNRNTFMCRLNSCTRFVRNHAIRVRLSKLVPHEEPFVVILIRIVKSIRQEETARRRNKKSMMYSITLSSSLAHGCYSIDTHRQHFINLNSSMSCAICR